MLPVVAISFYAGGLFSILVLYLLSKAGIGEGSSAAILKQTYEQLLADQELKIEEMRRENANLRGKNAALEHHSRTLDHELSRLGHRFTVTHPHGDPYREVQGQR